MSYVGFSKLKGELAHRPGVTNPGALAAAIGRSKYGASAMAKAAAKGTSLRGHPTKKKHKPVLKGPAAAQVARFAATRRHG